jgi:chromosome segregation ATPase
VSEISSIDERVEEIEREFYDDRQQRDTKRAVTALARALAEAERERNELRASIAYTVQVVNSQLDATFAAEDQAAERLEISRNEWKARAIAAEAKAVKDADCYEKNYKLIGELEELQKDLKRAKSDLSTSAARLSEAYRLRWYAPAKRQVLPSHLTKEIESARV